MAEDEIKRNVTTYFSLDIGLELLEGQSKKIQGIESCIGICVYKNP